VCYLNHGQFFSSRQGAAFLRNHLPFSAEFASKKTRQKSAEQGGFLFGASTALDILVEITGS